MWCWAQSSRRFVSGNIHDGQRFRPAGGLAARAGVLNRPESRTCDRSRRRSVDSGQGVRRVIVALMMEREIWRALRAGEVGRRRAGIQAYDIPFLREIGNRHASLPVAYRLYLPEHWAADDERRRKTGVPEDIRFTTKPEIALEQIRAASAAGLPLGVVLMDAGYGCNTELRSSISALGLTYVAGILPNTRV